MPTLATSQTRTGARESLSNVLIENDKSTLTVFPSIRKLGKPGAIIHTFPADRPGEVSNSGVVEGTNPAPASSMSPDYNLLTSLPHHIRVTVGVTKLNELLTDRAGVGMGKLLAREIAKALKAIGVALERVLLDEGDLQVQTSAVGYETRGFGKWCSNAAQGVYAVPTLFRTPSGAVYDETVSGGQTFAALTEDTFGDQLQSLFDENGDEEDVDYICGSSLRRKVSSWIVHEPDVASTTTIRRVDGSEDELRKRVTRVTSDFGTVRLHTSRFLFTPRGTALSARTDAQKLVSKRSGLGYCQGGIALRMIQDIMVNKLDPINGNSAGKNVELDALIMTEADPQRLAKIRVA
jgi:hypothetical protein